MPYPAPLQEVLDFCEGLSEAERREALWSYAEAAPHYAPQPGENYLVEDSRHDAECTDEVGIYLAAGEDGIAHVRIQLGPKVQTLTRAMTTILCKGFSGQPLSVILTTDSAFVPRIVGAELMRLRSRTVYYVLNRMREAAQMATQQHAPKS